MQVLLLAARPRHSPEETAQLRELCTPAFDWDRLVVLAAHHSLSPLVQAGLSRSVPELFPSEVRQTFQQRSMLNALHAFGWIREAARLCEALAAAGHPVAVLKGVPLSQQLYQSPHLRHVGDIDLLTLAPQTPDSLASLIATFDSLGYRRVNPAFRATPRRLRTYARFWKDLTFRHSTEGFEVDLHWRLFNHRLHPANRLLPPPPAVPVAALGNTVPVLPLREQLLHVVAHGVNDAWIYLKSLADVAGLLAILSPDELESILVHTEHIGLLPQLSAAIHLSNAWMGSSIESSRLLPSRHTSIALLHGSFARLLEKHSFTPTRDDRTPAEWVRLERAQIPGTRALAENVLRILWRPRIWQQFDLGDRLFWLYPLLGLALPPRADSLLRRKPLEPSEDPQLKTRN